MRLPGTSCFYVAFAFMLLIHIQNAKLHSLRQLLQAEITLSSNCWSVKSPFEVDCFIILNFVRSESFLFLFYLVFY